MLRGEVDIASAEGLADAICAVQGSPVVIDISGVTFMDSTGIAELVRARACLESNNNSLIIRGAAPIIRRVFGAVGMADWLEAGASDTEDRGTGT
jgi:anti-anti-sigma factor